MSKNFIDLIENALPVLQRNGEIDTMSLDGFSFENIKRGEYAFHLIGKLNALEMGELLAGFRKVGAGEVSPVGGVGTESLEASCRMLADRLADENLDRSIEPGALSIVAACSVVGIGRGFDYEKDSVEDVRKTDRKLVEWCIQYLKEHADHVLRGMDLCFLKKFGRS